MDAISKKKPATKDEVIFKDLNGSDEEIKLTFNWKERRKKEGELTMVLPSGKTFGIDKQTLLAFCLTVSPENMIGDFCLGQEQLVYQFWSNVKVKLEKDMKAGEVVQTKVPFRITKELFDRFGEVATEKDGILTPPNPFDQK